ncbi:MAG: hypothetical protein GXY28_06205 [Bacteriovoracaceae bacterium]|nr:hypothetical protein [Deltaproteobacteria bacterium]NLW67371.1 hypothetical protein [Bacteriovoracaceae bacterium]
MSPANTISSSSSFRLIQDIGGGIIGTAPDRKDWEHPDLHDYLEH